MVREKGYGSRQKVGACEVSNGEAGSAAAGTVREVGSGKQYPGVKAGTRCAWCAGEAGVVRGVVERNRKPAAAGGAQVVRERQAARGAVLLVSCPGAPYVVALENPSSTRERAFAVSIQNGSGSVAAEETRAAARWRQRARRDPRKRRRKPTGGKGVTARFQRGVIARLVPRGERGYSM